MVSVRKLRRYGNGGGSACDIHVYKKLCNTNWNLSCWRNLGTGISGKKTWSYMAILAYGIWDELQFTAADDRKWVYPICVDMHCIYCTVFHSRQHTYVKKRVVKTKICRTKEFGRFLFLGYSLVLSLSTTL